MIRAVAVINWFLKRKPLPSPASILRKKADKLIPACAASKSEAIALLGTSEKGMETYDIDERRAFFGTNEVLRGKAVGFFRQILQRFSNPLAIQLMIIAVLSLTMGDIRASTVVSFMLFLSVFLGHLQEARSNKAVEALQGMVKTRCNVIRSGVEWEIPMAELVPGDIVILNAGSIIPADIRLLVAKDFFVSQSALTGESMPLEKNAVAAITEGKSELELPNACFQGSTVLSGSARGLVVRTGSNTYFGSVSETLAAQRVLTSFDKGVNDFTWLMIRFMIVMVAIVFLIVGFTKGDWLQALLFGLAVAVGLTPEMLPMIVTVNLSKGALAMSRKKVIVKRLNAIQNFGAMNILCTDKTGTLTQDKIVLERHVDVTGRKSRDVLRYAYMNSHYQTGLRNLMDNAILAHDDIDVERTCGKVDEVPFDFSRRRMSVVIAYEGDHVMICKGAVEEIFNVCTQYQVDEEVHPLIDMLKHDLLEEYQELSAKGFRVLALAYREFPTDKQVFSAADEADLILLGYLAFFDPPKDSAAAAIRALADKGVRTKILTGDNDLVTRKVCHDVGLTVEHLVTGAELIGMSEEHLTAIAERTTVFAKLSPMQKEQIIRALHRAGHVVGFLGDGINDAPAMKAADVGISVDTAVDVAKESADIILLEKNLMVLEAGILEGRKVFGNILKYIKMGASSNFGNMFSLVGGSIFLPFLPMAPIQVLVNNLLYDFSQVGIPLDRVDEEDLERPRRWNIDNIKKFMLFVGPTSSVFDYATFFLMLYFFKCSRFASLSTAPDMKSYYEQLFHTGWFVESLLTQTLIVHIIRTNRVPFLQSRASGPLFATTVAVMMIAIYLPFSPLAHYLGLVALPPSYWIWIGGFLFSYSALTHLVKTIFVRRFGLE